MTSGVPALVADREAAALFAISRATFWRRVNDGTLPQPIRIGGVTRWRTDKLMEALQRLSGEGA